MAESELKEVLVNIKQADEDCSQVQMHATKNLAALREGKNLLQQQGIMAEVPTNAVLAWDALVQLTGASKGNLEEKSIEDDDAIKLEAAGYTTVARLKNAMRESLKDAGLKPASVDYVMRIIVSKAAQPGAAPPENLEEYQASSLDFNAFRQQGFLAPLPSPVQVHSVDARRCSLIAVPPSLSSVIQVGTNTFHDLSQYVMLLLQNYKSGTSEDGLHGRDDALLRVISLLGRMSTERASSSTASTRVDAMIGQPPMVLVEEEADPNELGKAMAEVESKFRWIPHYSKIDFVFGIAIAGDLLRMKAFSRQQNDAVSTEVFDLGKVDGCIKAFQAAVNVGRVCRHVSDNSLLYPATLAFNVVHKSERSRIHITHWQVTKTYSMSSMDAVAQQTLMEFYEETKGHVQFVEHATSMEIAESGDLVVTLEPVGLVRRPESVQEAKVAMRCIMEAMAGCSKLQWVLNDVRWANIVELERGFWGIIDCEFARRVGERFPEQLAIKCDWADTCSPSSDLFFVGRLLEDLSRHLRLDDELNELKRLLTSRSLCYDERLTPGQVLGMYAWLRAASPQGSPCQGTNQTGGNKRSAAQHEGDPSSKRHALG